LQGRNKKPSRHSIYVQKWAKNTHLETIEEEPLIIELEVEDLMVVWPDGLVYSVTIAVRSHIVELSNENMKNE